MSFFVSENCSFWADFARHCLTADARKLCERGDASKLKHCCKRDHRPRRCWDLGYFDGLKPRHVWIFPLVLECDAEFKGQEYLGLYPPVEKLDAFASRMNLGFTDVGEIGASTNERQNQTAAKRGFGPDWSKISP